MDARHGHSGFEPEIYDDDIIDYRYYLELLRTVALKHYKLIATFCAICIATAILYVQSQAPAYVATVTLHIAINQSGMFSFNEWMYGDDEKFQDTQVGILQSKKLMRQVVEKNNLHKMGKLTPASFDVGVARAVKSFFSSITMSDHEPKGVANEESQIEGTAGELSSLVTIGKPQNRERSNLMNVTVRMADPELAAQTANSIAETYIALVYQNEIDSALKNQEFLSERLGILREELRVAEQRLQDYRETENIVSRTSGRDEIDEELSSLSSRYFQARENRLRQENLYQQLQNISSKTTNWEKLPAVSNNPNINKLQSDLFRLTQRKSELSKRYGSRHNSMIAITSEINATTEALQNQVKDVVAGIRSELELAKKIEKTAEDTLAAVRDRKQQLGRTEYQLNDLVQAVTAKREVYAVFLERINQDGAAGPVRNDNLWIADPAIVPKAGQRTPLFRTGMIALVLSLGFALGIGVFFELTSNTLTTGDDVERKLGVPLLGYLPLIHQQKYHKEGLTFKEYIENPHSRFSEALRTIRTTISLLSLHSEGAKRFLVTSSQPHEGKTSVSLSLAAAFGQTARVLIVDCDLRKPSIEKILYDEAHKFRGLADVIADTEKLDDVIQHNEEGNFDVLTSGSRTPRPLELLASQRFKTVIDELSDRYDVIIIDSPPCISVSDAYLLATYVDSIIFVAKGEETVIPVIRTCLARFANLDVSIAGLLLNQINFEASHNGGKYQEYYSYHGYGDAEHFEESAKSGAESGAKPAVAPVAQG